MARYWKVLGEYNAESTTFSAFAGGGGASPYNPVEDARLKGLRVLINRAAASSLINGLVFRLTSSSFQPNTIEVAGVGGGLQTAPIAAVPYYDFEVDQPVRSGVQVTLEGKNVSETDTPVTVSALLLGLFDNGSK